MRRLLLLILAVIFFVPLGVSAQQAVTIEALEIELWPEYDQPEMLVIYRIELSADTELPVPLSIRIPAAAGKPFVLFVDDFGEPEYHQRIEGDWSVISFTTSGSKIQIEYYDPGLEKDGAKRNFTYTWPGDYPVNSFQVIAQLPFDATSFDTTPILSNEIAGTNGLSYRQGDFGSLSFDQQLSIVVEYQKSSDILSVDNPGTDGFIDDVSQENDWLVILLVIVGIGLIGFGVYTYTQSTSIRRRSRRSAGSTSRIVFCHQCGTQAQKGDQYCRGCGRKLRE
ncbi:MAG: zinc ribbon domain-containing protein [Anaerolineales bacterium]